MLSLGYGSCLNRYLISLTLGFMSCPGMTGNAPVIDPLHCQSCENSFCVFCEEIALNRILGGLN